MPVFDFECDNCGIKKELMVSIETVDNHDKIFCSNCGQTEFRRLLSAPRVILKGECWARDGYRSKQGRLI